MFLAGRAARLTFHPHCYTDSADPLPRGRHQVLSHLHEGQNSKELTDICTNGFSFDLRIPQLTKLVVQMSNLPAPLECQGPRGQPRFNFEFFIEPGVALCSGNVH